MSWIGGAQMEVGRSLTGHGLTDINKSSRRWKEKTCDSEDNWQVSRQWKFLKKLTALFLNKEVSDTMRKKLTVLNATAGYEPTSHGICLKTERTKTLTVSDRYFRYFSYWLIVTSRAHCLCYVASVYEKQGNVLVALALPGATCTRLSYYTVDTILYYTLS